MNKIWAMLGLIVLQLLALFYGKDPSIFSAAILIVMAMPSTAQVTVIRCAVKPRPSDLSRSDI